MLETLGFRRRTHVGISVSANDFIELVYINNATKSISRYASGTVKYNSAVREIMDFDEFSDAIEGLFDEAGLDPQECSVTLNLPNVHFGITPMGDAKGEMYILENLQDEIEDLFIFKRNSPIISYSKLPGGISGPQQNVVYAAIQDKMIAKIIEVFDKLGIELERIDNAYCSILKALKYSGRFDRFLLPGEKTGILLMTSNTFCSFLLDGDIIVKSKEVPLAIKSFSSEEVYATASKTATEAINEYTPQSLIIISETDDVNAELLGEKIDFTGDIEYVNKSLNPNEEGIISTGDLSPDIDTSAIAYLTLEAVGAAVSSYDDYRLNINFLPQEKVNKNLIQVGEYEVDWTRFVVILAVFTFVLAGIFSMLLSWYFNTQRDAVNSKNMEDSQTLKSLEDTLKNSSNKSSQKSIFPVMKQILETNQFIVDTYTGLSTEIPESVYIKKFVTNSNGGIGIVGESKTSEAVETFVNRLKIKNSDLMVSKLSVNSRNDSTSKIPGGFTFEIKTSNSDVDLGDDTLSVQNMQNNIGNQFNNVMNYTNQNTQRRSGMMRNTRNDNLTPPPAPVI